MTVQFSLVFRVVGAASIVGGMLAAPLGAQSRPKAKKAAAAVATPSMVGMWAGTATVPLKDSSIVVPVMYTFTQSAGTIGGMAVVPGQGSGAISKVVQKGMHVQFRVTAPEGKLLEHDGTVGADGAIEGMVNLDKQPVAKFRITQKPK